MSGTPAPEILYDVVCKCKTCGKVIYSQSTTDENLAKEGFAKAITAGELHDCKSGPRT
jgi:hypothetical protein